MAKEPPKLRPVHGTRVSSRSRKPSGRMFKVVITPGTPCLNTEDLYPMVFVKPTELTVSADAVGYEAGPGAGES